MHRHPQPSQPRLIPQRRTHTRQSAVRARALARQRERTHAVREVDAALRHADLLARGVGGDREREERVVGQPDVLG